MNKELRTFQARVSSPASDEIALFVPYNSISEPIGGQFVETLDPGCFSRALKDNADVLSLWNHDSSKPLARMGNNTMAITDHPDGLRAKLKLDTGISWCKDALASVKSGLVKHCSFGFSTKPGGDRWEKNGRELPLRHILSVDKLYELSPCTFPAYSETQARKGKVEIARRRDLMGEIDRLLSRQRADNVWHSKVDFVRAIVNAGKRGVSEVPSPIIKSSNRYGKAKVVSKDPLRYRPPTIDKRLRRADW